MEQDLVKRSLAGMVVAMTQEGEKLVRRENGAEGETGAEGEWGMRRILEKTKTGDGMGTQWRG